MLERVPEGKGTFRKPVYKLVYVLPSQNADLLLWMDLPLQAKRGKTPGSNILYSMWVNNTFHHQRKSSQR